MELACAQTNAILRQPNQQYKNSYRKLCYQDLVCQTISAGLHEGLSRNSLRLVLSCIITSIAKLRCFPQCKRIDLKAPFCNTNPNTTWLQISPLNLFFEKSCLAVICTHFSKRMLVKLPTVFKTEPLFGMVGKTQVHTVHLLKSKEWILGIWGGGSVPGPPRCQIQRITKSAAGEFQNTSRHDCSRNWKLLLVMSGGGGRVLWGPPAVVLASTDTETDAVVTLLALCLQVL